MMSLRSRDSSNTRKWTIKTIRPYVRTGHLGIDIIWLVDIISLPINGRSQQDSSNDRKGCSNNRTHMPGRWRVKHSGNTVTPLRYGVLNVARLKRAAVGRALLGSA